MFNPLTLATPQQKEQLARIQVHSQKIQYVIHSDKDMVQVTLTTEDPEAAKIVPQILESLVNTIGHTLYTMFAMSGSRE